MACGATGIADGRADIVTCQRIVACLAQHRGMEIGGEAAEPAGTGMTATTGATGPTIVHPAHALGPRVVRALPTFRLRLVDLVDELLDRMEADGRLRFTLDGNARR